MYEGIIDLHHILFYLYKCHEQTCCHGSGVGGLVADGVGQEISERTDVF